MFKTAPFTPSAIHRCAIAWQVSIDPRVLTLKTLSHSSTVTSSMEQFGKIAVGIGENAGQPQLLLRLGYEPHRILLLCLVADGPCGLARMTLAEFFSRAGDALAVKVGHDHRGAFAQENIADGPAQPSGCPGHQRYTVCKKHCHKTIQEEREAMASSSASIAWRKPQAMRLRARGGADKKEVEPVASRRRVRKFPRSA